MNGETARHGPGEELLPTSLTDALLVYAEPLIADAHVVVIGSADGDLAERLLEAGARRVHLFDPDPARAAVGPAVRGVSVRALGDLALFEEAFDAAIVPDLSELLEPREAMAALRHAVGESGSVIAMARAALTEGDETEPRPFARELGPASLGYGELYDLFAAEFEEVSLAGVVPFAGAVFAQLGDEEAPAVSVDTRLAGPDAPTVFVVVASQRATAATALDPYAIVQVPVEPVAREDGAASASAARVEAERLAAELEEARERAALAEARGDDVAALLERAASERDAALTRAMELEAVLGAAQQTIASLERRVLEAEHGALQRDERLALLTAELAAVRTSQAPPGPTDIVDVAEILARAERAEAALALHVADLAHVVEAHATETAAYEEQLRDRARLVAELEAELVRREELVRELVTSLEEQPEPSAIGPELGGEPPAGAPAPGAAAEHEDTGWLRRKLDELAEEVARREGELTARAWRIQELESELARREAAPDERSDAPAHELGRARDELDALRRALMQEHAARVAAESGEELARARSELARQAALLEQMRARS